MSLINLHNVVKNFSLINVSCGSPLYTDVLLKLKDMVHLTRMFIIEEEEIKYIDILEDVFNRLDKMLPLVFKLFSAEDAVSKEITYCAKRLYKYLFVLEEILEDAKRNY